jgi:hypothetical protein
LNFVIGASFFSSRSTLEECACNINQDEGRESSQDGLKNTTSAINDLNSARPFRKFRYALSPPDRSPNSMQVVAMFKRKLRGSTAQTLDVGVGEEYKENASMMNIDGQGLQGAKEEMARPASLEEQDEFAETTTPAPARRGPGRSRKDASQPPAIATLDAASAVEPETSLTPVRRSTRGRSKKIEEIQQTATVSDVGQERVANPASLVTPAPALASTISELSLEEEEEMLRDFIDQKVEAACSAGKP